MNTAELRLLIESDTVASEFYDAGNDIECASRCVAIVEKLNQPIAADDLQYHATVTGAWAAIKIAGESPETPSELKAACISFLDWVASGRSVDFELPVVQAMLSGLVQSELVHQELVSTINELRMVAPEITAHDVSEVRNANR
jgi:hypothetical protein